MSNKIQQQISGRIAHCLHFRLALLKELPNSHIQLIGTLVGIEEIEQILGRQSERPDIQKVGFDSSRRIGKRTRTLEFGRERPSTCSKQDEQGRLCRGSLYVHETCFLTTC